MAILLFFQWEYMLVELNKVKNYLIPIGISYYLIQMYLSFQLLNFDASVLSTISRFAWFSLFLFTHINTLTQTQTLGSVGG